MRFLAKRLTQPFKSVKESPGPVGRQGPDLGIDKPRT
jgi:hypothetical protein